MANDLFQLSSQNIYWMIESDMICKNKMQKGTAFFHLVYGLVNKNHSLNIVVLGIFEEYWDWITQFLWALLLHWKTLIRQPLDHVVPTKRQLIFNLPTRSASLCRLNWEGYIGEMISLYSCHSLSISVWPINWLLLLKL